MTTAPTNPSGEGSQPSVEAQRWLRERHYWVNYMHPSTDGQRTIHGEAHVPIHEPISRTLMQRIKDSIALDAHLPNGTFVVIVSMIQLEEP